MAPDGMTRPGRTEHRSEARPGVREFGTSGSARPLVCGALAVFFLGLLTAMPQAASAQDGQIPDGWQLVQEHDYPPVRSTYSFWNEEEHRWEQHPIGFTVRVTSPTRFLIPPDNAGPQTAAQYVYTGQGTTLD